MILTTKLKNKITKDEEGNTITKYEGHYVTTDGLFDSKDNFVSDVNFGDFFKDRKEQKYPTIILNETEIDVVTFVEVRGKTDYSMQDAISNISSIIKKSSVGAGVQDHGVGYGIYKLNQGMIAQGKKAINGAEFYIKTGELEYDHLVVISKNKQGYRDISKLLTISSSRVTAAESKQAKSRPWLVLEDFKDYDTNNFIVLHGYNYSAINRSLEKQDYNSAKEYLDNLNSIFNKDDVYLEIQYHDDKSIDLNDSIFDLADETGNKVLLTNDYHMIEKDDLYALEVMQAIGVKNTIVGVNNWHLTGDNWHFHTHSEIENWKIDKYLTDHSIEIFNKVESYDLSSKENFMPHFDIPAEFETDLDYFNYLAEKGLKVKIGKITKEYQERLDFETKIISEMGFVGYFLITADFIGYSKRSFDSYDADTVARWKEFIIENNYSMEPISIGPARGSVTGSLIAYGMGITEIDPIKYDLLFERFLNPERFSMPDIDTDIPADKRQEVIHYTKDYYNKTIDDFKPYKSKVAGMGTFGTYKVKGLVKAVVKALYDNTNYGVELTKYVGDDPKSADMSFSDYLSIPEVEQILEEDRRFERIVSVAPKLMGLTSNLTQHAAGYVIAPDSVTNYLPTVFVESSKTGEMEMLTAYTDVEAIGLLKMDFLGLRSMSIIDDAIQDINRSTGSKLTVGSILRDAPTDINLYRHIEAGNTGDLFQLASSGMTDVITRSLGDVYSDKAEQLALDGDYFARIIAGIAMYRPGPMAYIEDFIINALDPSQIEYPIDDMKPILSGSFGLMIYQESIMALLRVVAGFTLGGADLARRAISKKKTEDLANIKKTFLHGDGENIPGGLALGYTEDQLNHMWEDVETFAAYGFNKSHAAGYAHITIVMAYLAYYYPSYFAVSNLNHPQNKDSIMELISIYKKREIKTIPPSINFASDVFKTDGENIVFGIGGIKMVASKAPAIYEERDENGSFVDLYDFLSRMSRNKTDKALNKASIEGLIYAGALDDFPGSRKSKVDNIQKMTELISLMKKEDELIFDKTESSYFDSYLKLDDNEMNNLDKLNYEHKYTGFYISGHPTDEFSDIIKDLKDYRDVSHLAPNQFSISTLGTITNVHKITTKRGDIMAFLTIEDQYGSTECIMFPDCYKEYGRFAKDKEVVIIFGDVNDEGRLIISSMDFAQDKVISRLVDHIQINVPDDPKEASDLIDKIMHISNQNSIGNLVSMGYVLDDKEYFATRKYDNLSISNDVDTINYIKSLIGKENFSVIWKSYY